MPLEATICMLDNSDYAINSDVVPTRLAAGADAVRTIFRAKTQSNPESTCGFMTFGGTGPVVLVSPTTEEGKIHVALPTIKPHGVIDLLAGLAVAGLALKHRQDKNQRQRAIVLLSSPLPATIGPDELTKLGKRLKKNNVAVDIILFGSEAPENEVRMRSFVDAVNSGGNSHFLLVPAGAPGPLGDHIKASDILAEEGFGSGAAGIGGGVGAGAPGPGGDAGGFDLDPNLDPELAMALRMSLQEEEARQAALAAQSASPAPAASGSATARAPPVTHAPAAGARAEPPKAPAKGDRESDALLQAGEAMEGEDEDEDENENDSEQGDEDEELTKALAMSRGDDVEMGEGDEEMSEEEAIARAIEMSMNENKDGKK